MKNGVEDLGFEDMLEDTFGLSYRTEISRASQNRSCGDKEQNKLGTLFL